MDAAVKREPPRVPVGVGAEAIDLSVSDDDEAATREEHGGGEEMEALRRRAVEAAAEVEAALKRQAALDAEVEAAERRIRAEAAEEARQRAAAEVEAAERRAAVARALEVWRAAEAARAAAHSAQVAAGTAQAIADMLRAAAVQAVRQAQDLCQPDPLPAPAAAPPAAAIVVAVQPAPPVAAPVAAPPAAAIVVAAQPAAPPAPVAEQPPAVPNVVAAQPVVPVAAPPAPAAAQPAYVPVAVATPLVPVVVVAPPAPAAVAPVAVCNAKSQESGGAAKRPGAAAAREPPPKLPRSSPPPAASSPPAVSSPPPASSPPQPAASSPPPPPAEEAGTAWVPMRSQRALRGTTGVWLTCDAAERVFGPDARRASTLVRVRFVDATARLGSSELGSVPLDIRAGEETYHAEFVRSLGKHQQPESALYSTDLARATLGCARVALRRVGPGEVALLVSRVAGDDGRTQMPSMRIRQEAGTVWLTQEAAARVFGVNMMSVAPGAAPAAGAAEELALPVRVRLERVPTAAAGEAPPMAAPDEKEHAEKAENAAEVTEYAATLRVRLRTRCETHATTRQASLDCCPELLAAAHGLFRVGLRRVGPATAALLVSERG